MVCFIRAIFSRKCTPKYSHNKQVFKFVCFPQFGLVTTYFYRSYLGSSICFINFWIWKKKPRLGLKTTLYGKIVNIRVAFELTDLIFWLQSHLCQFFQICSSGIASILQESLKFLAIHQWLQSQNQCQLERLRGSLNRK